MPKADKLNALTPSSSCTYWEAIVRVRPFWLKAVPQAKLGIEGGMFLMFCKSSIAEVRSDLERGTP